MNNSNDSNIKPLQAAHPFSNYLRPGPNGNDGPRGPPGINGRDGRDESYGPCSP